MKKIRFAVVGGGWRAEFFARIAKQLPDVFEMTSTLLRDPEKGRTWEEKFHVPCDYDVDVMLASKPEFIVLSITKPATDVLLQLMKCGTPILCETPPGVTHEALRRVWDAYKETGAKVQVAEQYGYQPMYMAWQKAIEMGLIGRVSNLSISSVHSYHAASLIRSFLGVGFARVQMEGKRYYFDVKQTDSRQGIVLNGEVFSARRDRLALDFEGGKTAFFDFSPVQYESFIRTRHFSVQGERGEIDDLTIRYLTEAGEPVEGELKRLDQGVYNNRHFSHYGIAMNGRYVYKSPFPYARFNDDEIAVAHCLQKMGAWVRGEGGAAYSLEDALQDAYLAILMEDALRCPGNVVLSEAQPWHA